MKFLISCSLPYCNNQPHLGNICSSMLSGDVYARYKRSQGHEVIYLCGTDEYGSTTTIKANQEGLTPKEICDKYHQIHKNVYDWFNIKFDVWGRTSTNTQTEITQEIFMGLYKNGYIEEKTMIQMYCEKCNLFLADRYIKGTCYHDECKNLKSIANGDQCDTCQKPIDVTKLINPFCYICKSIPVPKETNHLFLKLDNLSDKINKYISESNFSPNVLSIAKSWLDMGLNSRCITRDLSWGTPIPPNDKLLESYNKKVFYVWFDAPFGYYSILAEKMPNWREWINSPDLVWVATQAKDNIPFHTIVFPGSILGSSVKLPLINRICATDYLLYEKQKFSKSGNVGIFGNDVIEISNKLDINEDYWRFYLMKIRPENHDSSFLWSDFVQTIKSDMINNIGNYINRCLVFTSKYCNNQTIHRNLNNTEIDNEINKFIDKYNKAMEDFKFRDALNTCLELSSFGNQYVQSKQLWILIKDNNHDSEISEIMGQANYILCVLLNLLHPFIPKTVETLTNCFSTEKTDSQFIFNIKKVHQLPFRKIELDNIKKIFGDLN